MSVLIVTSLGDIVIDLHTSRCPLTTKNFLKLCKMKYYNGCLFHTVQKDFNAQTGDPTGKGTGGDSIYKFLYGEQARFFGDEIHPDLKHSKTGTVSMANAGENLNASQFYFTLRDDLDYLDGKHTVFGEVAEGLETLTRINEAFVDDKGRPYKNIRIKHTYILDDPFDDPSQLAELIPDASPEGKPSDELEDVRLEDDWVPMEEQMDAAEIQESLQNKEAHSRAVLLEMIGDIPEAEIKPPENVLFVCKLNPVTQDSDLDVIFSRFGNVVSADIIRDYKTGDSLCYAFIEFETEEACEQAYFKMDNALIDDRRIHVDFSQSVAKLWSQYRRGGKRTQGKGCFKCGALDHIAKDCTGGADTKSEPQKYILKDNNAQHGDGHKSYEMVFDGNGSESSGHEGKRQREQETEVKTKKLKTRGQGSDDSRHKDHERHRGSSDRHGQDDKSQQHREDERTRETSKSKQIGNRIDGYCMSEIREERAEKHHRDRGYQQRTVSDRHGRGEERDGSKSSSNEHSEGEERDGRKSRDYGMERRRDVSKRSRDEERSREEGRDGRKSQDHGRGEGRDGRKSQDHGRGEERDVNNRRDDKHSGGDEREVRKSRDYGSVEERDGSKRSRDNEHGRGGVREIRKSGDHERGDDKHSRGDDIDVRKSRDHGRGGVREIRKSRDHERGGVREIRKSRDHERGDDRDVRKSRDHGRVEEREGTKSRGDEYNRGDERDGGSSRGHDREHYSDRRNRDERKRR